MVYSIGVRYPYPINIGTSFPDANEDADRDVAFLNPEEIDTVSLNRKRALTSGYPVDPATVPTKLCWESKRYDPTDFIVSRGTLVVSERVREIIERFEPGVHQLLPVDVYRPKADAPIARYYWLVVCNRIDSVDEKKTTFVWTGDKSNERGLWLSEGDESRQLVFNKAQIDARHIWRDKFLAAGVLVSEELMMAFSEAGISGLESMKYASV
ncbi:MAG TPA: hypothetical protein PKC48_13450 [Sphingorhabdus sp.]|jgi:hypothetical protein|uniref:imm11 family protein n=1 Tax=Sphingorhabdus sp. TaxID=1902408 RepID=UPI002C366BE9|nr:DUF1629 domain-containing protein [Sphingorhabdus sp.]HMT41744.1 hypothetical protein [Sphingorhabdus sp.]HMU23298.1 hypothetical protein [Sphingorhabdus sp.]